MKLAVSVTVAALLGMAAGAAAQKPGTESARAAVDSSIAQSDTATRWGAIDPGNGFMLAKTDVGTIAVSVYALWRYINQLPASETYRDHLGNLRDIHTRNDLQLHRILASFKGWVYLPKFSYVVTMWTVNATQQVAIVGNLQYSFAKQLNIGGGINGLPGIRSLLGSHPYWLGTDRFLAEEFFRPGFTGGIWATGEMFPRLYYSAMIGNNISQLGITASQLTRHLATATSFWWVPTTGEFGPRGGFGDYEDHQRPAVRLGSSYTHSRENRFNQLTEQSPDNTQIRLSDGVLAFETGALAPGITLIDATYQLNAFDAGLKYKGLFLFAEAYMRRLNRFSADSALSIADVFDSGWELQAAYMVVKKKLEVFLTNSEIDGQFNRAWEVAGGLNWFPDATRNLRVNLFFSGVNRSPVGSTFGYYAGGLRGNVVSLSTSVFF
jgi:hypothetical protein